MIIRGTIASDIVDHHDFRLGCSEAFLMCQNREGYFEILIAQCEEIFLERLQEMEDTLCIGHRE